MKITKEIVWELIKTFNPNHPQYGTVVSFLANYAINLTPSKKEIKKK